MTQDAEMQDQNYSSGVASFEAKNFSMAMQFLSPIADAGNPAWRSCARTVWEWCAMKSVHSR